MNPAVGVSTQSRMIVATSQSESRSSKSSRPNGSGSKCSPTKKTIREAAEHELQAAIEECYAKHRPLIEKAQTDEKRARYDAMATVDIRRLELELSDGCRDLRLSTTAIDEELESIRRRLSVIQLDGHGWRRQADDAARVIDELGDEVERLKGQSMLTSRERQILQRYRARGRSLA